MPKKEHIKKMVVELCNLQKNYIMEWPKRENITKYESSLDIESNEDFAIWEIEMWRSNV